MDVIFENHGRSVVGERGVDDQREGSSHRGEDWRRMRMIRRIGSNRRRVGTWLSEEREEGSVYNQILGGVVDTYGCHECSIRATRFIGIFLQSLDRILALEPWELSSKRAQIEQRIDLDGNHKKQVAFLLQNSLQIDHVL